MKKTLFLTKRLPLTKALPLVACVLLAAFNLGCGKSTSQAVDPVSGGMGAVKVRDDVEIKINNTREAATLDSSGSSHLPQPAAGAGNTFLLVNVTVNFKGSGSLQVSEGSFRLTASNKQFYMGGLHGWVDNPANFTILMANLAPGGTATGDVIFEVEPGLKVEKLDFMDFRP